MDANDRLEILKMAREIVVNEHIDRRAELHNRWLFESDHLWKTQKVRVAYPTIPPHPTEGEIVERAKLLMQFVESGGKIEPKKLPNALRMLSPNEVVK